MVELLLVIALIAIIASLSVKVAITGPRLQSAMAQCVNLVERARQAAMNQSARTRLLVSTSRSHDDDFLRVLHVVSLEDDHPRRWRAEGPPLKLPDTLLVDVASSEVPPHGRRLPSMRLDLESGLERGPSFAYVPFSPTGVTSLAGTSLVIGEGKAERGRIIFKGEHRKARLLLHQASQSIQGS